MGQLRQFRWIVVMMLLLLAGAAARAQVSEPTPLPLYALPDSHSRAYVSNTIALSNDGGTLAAANMLNSTLSFISVLNPTAPTLLAEIEIGPDPRGLALTPDNSRVLVAQRGDNSLAVVDFRQHVLLQTIPLDGLMPWSVVTDRNDRAYVSLQGSGAVVIVDLAAGAEIGRIPVPDFPAGLGLWGDFLYVTHFWSGEVSLIYLPEGRVVETIRPGGDVGLSQGLEIDVTRGLAYLPQTRANTPNQHLLYDTTVFPMVNVVVLRDLTAPAQARIDLSTADRPVNMPFAVALDRFRNLLYVANAGSNDVSVIDLDTGLARANVHVRANPRGILLNRDNTFLFVHNAVEGSLSVIETSRLVVVDVLPISDPRVSTEILIGAELFHSAGDPRLGEDRWLSCATCHFDGLADGRTWWGFDDGPRNTPLLFNLIETPPYNQSGTWDELHDVEFKIRSLMAGTGLIEGFTVPQLLDAPNVGLSFELDLLVSYLLTLQPPPNPAPLDDAAVQRGQQVFAAQGCATCHAGTTGTDLQSHDVGTGDPALEKHGLAFDTPALRHLWLSAPYFHDGSAATLMAVFTLPGTHQLIQTVPVDDIAALVDYLLNWS